MSVTETTPADMLARKAKLSKKQRNIGHFCGGYIYDDCCLDTKKGRKCNRMHTRNLDMIKEYLDDKDGKTKSVLCERGAHCHHFLCQWGHDFDHIIFGHTDPEDPNRTIFQYNDEERAQARAAWKTAKHQAYVQELVTGQREPKNQHDQDLIDQYNLSMVSVNTANFPSLPTNPQPIQPPQNSVWVQNEQVEVVVEQPAEQIDVVPETIVEPQQISLDDINNQFHTLCQFFNTYPGYFQDPMFYRLFQLTCIQNNLLNEN